MQKSSFANNLGLCGKPLDACRGPSKQSHNGVIVGAAIGGTMLAVVAIGAILLFSFRKAVTTKRKEEDLEGNKRAKSIKGTNALKHVKGSKEVSKMEEDIKRNRWTWNRRAPKGTKVYTFEKLVRKMRLSNIMKATDSSSEDNIISCGRTGIMYKAMLPNGSLLAVKRMQNSHHSIKRFISETTVLGSIQHRNVVPLLGFCIARGERLLVYVDTPCYGHIRAVHLTSATAEIDEPTKQACALEDTQIQSK